MRKTHGDGGVSDRCSHWSAPGRVQRKRRQHRRLHLAGRTPAEVLEGRILMARDLYVDIASPGPVRDGSSWASAYADLQLALAVATSGDRILIADGTYTPTATTNRTISFVLREGVGVYGGYAGYGAANPDARDLILYPTILSGEVSDAPPATASSITDTAGPASGDWRAVSGEAGGAIGMEWGTMNNGNSYHVVTGTNVGRSTLLDGLTITGGRADSGDTPHYRGGGIYLWSASPTLNNITFRDNVAIGAGGGLAAYGSSAPLLTDCLFVGNRAQWGGGMTNANSSSVLSNTAFIENAAASSAGGLDNFGSAATATLTNCTFTRNAATLGGGISNVQASLVLTSSAFAGNCATSQGGAIFNRYTFNRNTLAVTNSTFSGNSAHEGGAIYADSGTITNSTFVGNTPVIEDRGQILAYGAMTVSNSIVWGGGVPFYATSSSNLSVSYSNIQGGFAGIGNTNVEPQFVRSPWAGPDGVFSLGYEFIYADTRLVSALDGDDYGDLRLRPTSPLLNAGSNLAIPAGITTDLAGQPRIQDGTVAMGAYETPTAAPPARMLYVDVTAPGASNGSSWRDAFTSLQSALTEARDGDVIRVADGTYRPTATADRAISFVLRNGVSILGGYAGYGAADPDARDFGAYPAILSGDIGVAGSNGDNSYNVVVALGVDSATVLNGFTITGGRAVPDSVTIDWAYGFRHRYGGGMYNARSSPTLANLIFTANSGVEGGAMYNTYSAPTLTNCTFTVNASVNPNDESASARSGGAVSNDHSSLTLTHCTFTDNSAFTNDPGVGGTGGAMNNYYSSVTATDTSFIRNSARTGGALYNEYSPVTLINCTFAGNSATVSTSAIYSRSAPLTMTNSVVVGNTSGAISTSNSNRIFTNCTFVGDVVFSEYGRSSFGYSMTVTNSILGPGATLYQQIFNNPIVTYSSIVGGFPGTGNVNADPLFVRNPSAGADGTWGTADDDYGDLRLQSSSLCINAGNNAAPGLAGITTDLAGRSRTISSTVDMGAYEFDPPPTLTSTAINDGAVQRSMVKGLAVTFSEPVTLAPGAVTVKLSTGQAVPNTTVSVTNPSGDQKSYILSFSGSAVIGGSLADGIYDLLVSATGVQDLAGNALTANYSQRFHRLFGDSDGNRVVNALDYARLRNTLGRAATDPLFNSSFDYEGNTVINALDLARFRQRYGLSFSY